MIKTYPDQAAFDAAEKSKMESTVGLLENTGKVVLNGVNVITDQPKVGDIACYDENRKIVFIQCDTYQGGTFPSAWETVGVVVIRKGNKVTVLSKANKNLKIMEVLPYVVSGYQLDGTEHTVTVNFYGTEAKEFKYTASTDSEFVSQLKQFLTTNGETNWSAYIMDGKVILHQDNYASPYLKQTTASGLTLTTMLNVHLESEANPRRRCGSNGWAVYHAARLKEVYIKDLTGTANPTTDVTFMPDYPVCWPAFAGTSQYQEDHCLWLRQQYCKDPAHPTVEEWEAYVDDMVLDIPTMVSTGGVEYRSGKEKTEQLKGIEYQATDGSRKKLFTGVVYCSEFMDGKGYFPSMAEQFEAFSTLTYGLAGVNTIDKADPINRSLHAIGGQTIYCFTARWMLSKTNSISIRNGGASGFIDGYPTGMTFRCVPFADIDLSEINE